MFFLIFFSGGAAAMTAWTKHALGPFEKDNAVCVEAHDDWPEQRSFENFLTAELTDDVPDNVGYMTVDEFCERYVKGGITYV